MKLQGRLLLAFVFALIVAIFAVMNVHAARLNYIFGSAAVPLILIILIAALLGGLIVGPIGLYNQFRLRRQNRQLELRVNELETLLHRQSMNEADSSIHNDPQKEHERA